MSAARTASPQGVGRVLKAWRRRRKLTQKELAARTSLTPSALSAFERGESAPSHADRKRICAALEVESRDFDAEIAWAEGGQKGRELSVKASDPEKLTVEELSASWDVVATSLKPWFLKLAEWALRDEGARARRKGSKP